VVFKGKKGQSDSIQERLKAGGALLQGDIGPTVDSSSPELGLPDTLLLEGKYSDKQVQPWRSDAQPNQSERGSLG
jgi:hypothetical protein